jgi:hypothetical protein
LKAAKVALAVATIAVGACYAGTGDTPGKNPATCSGAGCANAVTDAGPGPSVPPPNGDAQVGGGGALLDAEAAARCPGVDLMAAPRLANAGGRFVVGGVAQHIAVSGDGAHWESESHTPVADAATPSVNFYSMAQGPGLLLAASWTGVHSSPDGVNWTPHRLPDLNTSGFRYETGYTAAAYGKGQYVVAAGAAFAYLVMYHSPDGVTWNEDPYFVAWEQTCCLPIWSIVFGGDRFVGVGASRRSIVSDDGITWHDDRVPLDSNGRQLSDDVYYASVAYGNGVYVAVGSRSIIAYSTNGIEWTDAYVDVLRDAGADADPVLVVDPNRPIGDFNTVVFDGTKFITCARTGCYTSTDGAAWAAAGTAIGDPRPTKALTYKNGLYLGIDIPAQILTSNDGSNWTPVFCGGPPRLDSLAFLPSP